MIEALPNKNTNTSNAENNDILFQKIRAKFIEKYGDDIFNKWLSELTLFSCNSNEIILSAPSKFVRDWVVREFIENKKIENNLQKIIAEINPEIKRINLISSEKTEQKLNNSLPKTADITSKKIINLSKYDNVFAIGSELNPKYTFANFVNAKYNKLALGMARIAAGAKDIQANLFGDEAIPLYIHGGIGMGKTHLAQAIAWHIKENDSSKKVVYLSAEKFMYNFVQAVRSNDTMSFKEKFRTIDVLIIDDVQFIAKKQGTQDEFMQTFNNLVENNKQVILVCDRSPLDLESVDEKLKSRISGGMIVNFKHPDFSDRLEILKAKSLTSGEKIDDKILEFLAGRITSSVRDLDGALRKLIASKIFMGEDITLDAAKSVASSYFDASTKNQISFDKIKKIIAAHYEIKISGLSSENRTRSIARPRQIAMYFAKNLTNESLPKIGYEFGKKNHATVIYAIKTINKMISEDENFAKELKIIEEKIHS